MKQQFNFDIEKSIWLAPMAGATDYAFRCLAKANGCDVTVTEMVSAKALYYKDKKSFRLMDPLDEAGSKGIQIFGSDPEVFKSVSKMYLSQSTYDFVDINMGCPAPKIIKNGEGSALMKDPELAQKLVYATKSVADKPVTVKMRIGFDSVCGVAFAKALEAAGADLITVHGRTREQMYSGEANWNEIARIRDAVSIPLIGNGDIFTPSDVMERLNSGICDGVMIGRGAQGRPWLFRQIKDVLEGKTLTQEPNYAGRVDLIKQHINLMLKTKPDYIVALEMRKHVAWYLKGLSATNKLKADINKAQSVAELLNLLDEKSF